MTFDEYVQAVGEIRQDAALWRWRLGQTYFNLLDQVRPDLSARVRASEVDPFYRDDQIPLFLEFVESNWQVGPDA